MRANFEGLVVLPSLEDKKSDPPNNQKYVDDSKPFKHKESDFFNNQKYVNHLKPFQQFILYKSFMLVTHGNIISYYDIFEEKWKCHYKFKESPNVSSVTFNANQTYAYIIKKKVLTVFRHESKNDKTLGIGVLFHDGSFENMQLETNIEG